MENLATWYKFTFAVCLKSNKPRQARSATGKQGVQESFLPKVEAGIQVFFKPWNIKNFTHKPEPSRRLCRVSVFHNQKIGNEISRTNDALHAANTTGN